MKIPTSQITKLRQDSGAGIMDCREALFQAKGDIDKAKKILLKKGLAKAAKKKGRDTAAGIIYAYIHHGGQAGALVHLACETDFVARTDEFKQLAHELAMQIVSMKPENTEELLEQDYIRDPAKKIKDLMAEMVSKVGENITVNSFSRKQV